MNTGCCNHRLTSGRCHLYVELAVWVFCLFVLVYAMSSVFFYGDRTLLHDNVIWYYPAYYFFATGIISGQYPLWNPFTHGGEPFYPVIAMNRFLDPNIPMVAYLGGLVEADTTLLFNWSFLIQILLAVLGVYIFLRRFTTHLLVRLSLLPILMFMSFSLCSLRQYGILALFAWAPFIAHLLVKMVFENDCRWRNWLLLAALVGLNWQSYHFAGVWVFLLFFFSGVAMFRFDLLKKVVKSQMFASKFITASAIVLAMTAPNAVLMLEKDKYVFPARMLNTDDIKKPIYGPQQFEGSASTPAPEGIMMPYRVVAVTGTPANIWNFIQIIAPEGNPYIHSQSQISWGNPSEAYMYIGLLPWAIALFGIIAGKNELKKIWLLLLAAFGLLMLGAKGGLHAALFYLCPPLWFIRHTHLYVMYFIFMLLFFYIIGFNRIIEGWRGRLLDPAGNDKSGPFGRLLKRPLAARIIATGLFIASITGTLYFSAFLDGLQMNLAYLPLVGIFIVGWVFRDDLGQIGMIAGILTGCIALVLILNGFNLRFIVKTIILMGLPIGLFAALKKLRATIAAAIICIAVFSASLTWDAFDHLRLTRYLYSTQPDPMMLVSSLKNGNYYIDRAASPEEIPNKGVHGQVLRYVSLIEKRPYALSTATSMPRLEDFSVQYDPVLLPNTSFEFWDESKPVHFYYLQGGSGGYAKPLTSKRDVIEGVCSALISPSSEGNSMLIYKVDNIEKFRGHHMMVAVWVKSGNKAKDAVQIHIQDGEGSTVESYSNSGEWEHIKVVGKISDTAAFVLITLNVKYNANSTAVFDDIELFQNKRTLSGHQMDDFERALYNKKWSTYLMLKNYFHLVNSDIPAQAMKEMFAIGTSTFQYKRGAIETNSTETLLKRLGDEKASLLLKDFMIVDKQDPAIPQNYVATRESIEQIVQYSDNKSGFIPHIKRQGYNFVEIKASAGKDGGLLYWSQGYDRWWKAYVNGQEAQIYRVNDNFMAIVLPEGNNTVFFKYRPIIFIASLVLFYSAFAVATIFYFIDCRGTFSSEP